jgi:hypothetical protein
MKRLFDNFPTDLQYEKYFDHLDLEKGQETLMYPFDQVFLADTIDPLILTKLEKRKL